MVIRDEGLSWSWTYINKLYIFSSKYSVIILKADDNYVLKIKASLKINALSLFPGQFDLCNSIYKYTFFKILWYFKPQPFNLN